MYKLIESADYDTLFAAYLADHDRYASDPYSEYHLIINTLPEGDILLQKVADARGIVSGVHLRYWNNHYWHLVNRITGGGEYGNATPLTPTAIRWHLYSYLYQHGDHILADPAHPLHPLLHQHWPEATRLTTDMTRRLWTYSSQLASLYNAYLSQRPDWLDAWQQDPPPALDELIQGDGLARQPAPLVAHYREHYQQQQHLWRQCFAAAYAARAARIRAFWHKLAHEPAARDKLPAYLPIYAPATLTPATYHDMTRLGQYCEVRLYHLAAADGEYSDIVDSRWLRELILRDPKQAEAGHYDHGNTLLSRYGKQQRDLARLLHGALPPVSSEEHDAPDIHVTNLLSAVQADIRSQSEGHIAHIPPRDGDDDSLRINGCQGLLRQCETLRSDIVTWLNSGKNRHLSDILILLPDPAAAQDILRAVFPASGEYDGYRLPARIVGTPDNAATNLWQSLAGHYTHLNGRFDAPTITDWLQSDDTCRCFGISSEQMQRITTALIDAGYKRGFDDTHLQQTLSENDHDYRYTYTYALDRLITGVLMPDAAHHQESVPLGGMTLADLPALEALATFAEGQRALRDALAANTPAQTWNRKIRDTLHHDYAYAHNSTAWQTIDRALEDIQTRLAAHQALAPQNDDLYLPLPFILENIEARLAAQQNSSEPSGVITIGSLNQLHNLPYKLIAFINADHDRYPTRQNDERYNLISIDRPRPGDHNREHADLAALLDSINRAGEACWIYYNDADPADNEERLPASPVQELLQYLDEQQPAATNGTVPRPAYHRSRSATPFTTDAAETRPAPLWHDIQRQLRHKHPAAPPFLTLSVPPAIPADTWPQENEPLPLEQLIRDNQKPASAYARAHDIHHERSQMAPDSREPLAADGLTNYQINSHINRALAEGCDPAPALMRLPILPAGASGRVLLDRCIEENRASYAAILAQSGCDAPPPLAEQTLDLGGAMLTARLPDKTATTWPRLSAGKKKAKHQYRHWLEHLAWNALGSGGDSYIHYPDGSEKLNALPAGYAASQLRQWLTMWQNARSRLWLAPIELMPAYLDNLGKQDADDNNQKLIRNWMNDHDNKLKADDDLLWQYLWRGNTEEHIMNSITAALTIHAPLLHPWRENSETIS